MKLSKSILKLTVLFVVVGQIIFIFATPDYTKSHYENRIFATTGVEHDTSDLSKLNEAAHYFGQTMIGWTKFPHFVGNMITKVGLPKGTTLNAHIQERQNIIFSITTPKSIDLALLKDAKDYLQSKIDEYNSNTRTRFILTNVDYDQIEIKRSYASGALITLILTIVLAGGFIFIRKELF